MTCGKGLLPPHRKRKQGEAEADPGDAPPVVPTGNRLSDYFAEQRGESARSRGGSEDVSPAPSGSPAGSANGVGNLAGAGRKREKRSELLFKLALYFCVGVGLVTLATLLIQVTTEGWEKLNWDLLERFPSSLPARAGIQSALFGTIWVVGLTALMAIPVGVAAAIYLEEYADSTRWYNRAIEINIQNLAAVPAIIYGVLGLGMIYRGPLSFGPTVMTAALTLSLLVLPIVIIASREAIRAVPNSIRLGALALGATQLQTIRRQVLPAAVPGIATASILALSRAIGEAAPLLLLGAAGYISFNPDGVDSRYTVLPVQILQWIQSPRTEFKILAAAAIIVLLAVLLAMNSVAIFIRNRYQRKW